MSSNNLPEILAPAGNFEKLQTVLTYGADAIYLSGQELSLRAQSQGFAWHELQEALDKAHQNGKRIYFCLNIFPYEKLLVKVQNYLNRLYKYPIDALIVSDPGVIDLAQNTLPHVPLHLSTQANTYNSASVRFWQRLGIKRINLARELNLKMIRLIRGKNPDIELETFVHGAMCMALSGRCLLSAYLNQRSANQGLCTHPCRYHYRPTTLFLEEKKRPDRPIWELREENNYSEILASEDLCLFNYLSWFLKVGIDSLKIEGRMKTSSYLAPVVDVYSTAIKDLQNKIFRPKLYLRELNYSLNRPISTGFFLPGKRKIIAHHQNKKNQNPVLAKILNKEKEDKWLISIRHRWHRSDELQILVPGLKRPYIYSQKYKLENKLGEEKTEVHSGTVAWLRCDHPDLKENFFLRKGE